ncbi:TetR/AcrR family transcriptional regulator [Thalassospira sp. MCCC 1A01428]|uniref:TetR/AcrR family transcriptional regulator n=1 Tax=Thalassospira sp. MCCC 1A01428 TaxID=1470575 RepID=UPI000A1F551E|nr:TetR/AcrR family transcriptional regulator [Thalassospira sp. MCCC 1A01428]OSQ43133.1 TetR family transcriptional regulator [Thalassospira sp. MCCC 1A01428]
MTDSQSRPKPAKTKPKTGQRDPERTRALILEAATSEFAEKGIGGARVDAIAARAGTNKRMLYHYFGDKDQLYTAVLGNAYAGIRNAEKKLNLSGRTPEDGIRELALFTWHYFVDHPEFLSLLGTENLHRAEYLKQLSYIPEMHSHFITELAQVLKRGEADGVFHAGIDPLNVYLTMASMTCFYLNNHYTLSTIFGRDLMSDDNLDAWMQQIVSVTLASIRAR